MRDIITLSLLTTFLVSCNHKQEESVSYFGGEIINPNSRYVVLYKNDDPVDSAALDGDNRFLIKLNNAEEGLYHFEHQPEYQYVFIEKGDSILIRLNTYDFDESLVFTGTGAAKNNFLVEMFLMSEDEERLIYSYYEMNAEDFNRKMDSLHAMKMIQYQNLLTDYDLSEDAKHITRAGIDYTHYSNMEIYPYMNMIRNNLDEVGELPEGFYDYRAALNDNDNRLSYFRPYFNYMVAKMNNLSYVHHMENRENETVAIEKTLQYHTYKLHLVDSLVEDTNLRDDLYRNIAYIYFLSDKHPENDNKVFLEKFNMLSKNETHIEGVNRLHRSIQNLQPGKILPTVALINTNNDAVGIENVFTSTNRIFYFWSVEQKNHVKNISKKVKALEKKYPSYKFIGINVNDNHEKWLKYINAFFCDVESQFRTEDYRSLREQLVISNLNKVIITTGDGIIIDAFANIYNKNFEPTLKAHQKKNKAL